jgi:hypothetical protein
MLRIEFLVKTIIWFAFKSFGCLPFSVVQFLCKNWVNYLCLWITINRTSSCTPAYAQVGEPVLHQKFALTIINGLLRWLASTVERVGTITLSQPKVD